MMCDKRLTVTVHFRERYIERVHTDRTRISSDWAGAVPIMPSEFRELQRRFVSNWYYTRHLEVTNLFYNATTGTVFFCKPDTIGYVAVTCGRLIDPKDIAPPAESELHEFSVIENGKCVTYLADKQTGKRWRK